ncbi:MAG: ThiF family adenylyltransferase [Planctomycetota bacterium]
MADRYSRQRLLGIIGDAGQARLRAARVLLVGCGALGTHIAQHLVRAGVGTLRICDRDYVDLDNLQRQVLYDEDDVRAQLPKAVAAERKLTRINSEVVIDARVTDATAQTIHGLLEHIDLVLDGTDNFETRYLLNDACVEVGRPWVYGGCVATHGMVLAVVPGETPCFACVVPEAPAPGTAATCDTAGVLGPAVGIVAALQATEALKLLVGARQALNPNLQTIDPWRNEFRSFTIPRNLDCDVCAHRNFRHLRAAAGSQSTVLCGRNSVQISPTRGAQLDFAVVAARLATHGPVRTNEHLLRFNYGEFELTLFTDGRALIKGTAEPDRARAFYAKFIGA